MKAFKFFIFGMVLLSLVNIVMATDACCEKTTSGEYCQYTDEKYCMNGFRKNYATCEQTSYCNLGCCFSQDDGRCFKNTPQATCDNKKGTFSSDASCSVPQCSNGCCMIGTEAFFVTEVKCKETGSKYTGVGTVFDSSITDEKTCLAKSRSQETGCCVNGNSCSFTTRSACNMAEGNNETREGFFKDMLCSNDKLSCGCSKQHHTDCYQGKVYWYDSCGNRENVYSSNKDTSYNKGYITEVNCKATLNDKSCGNCDYAFGTICGNSSEIKPMYGDYICKDVNCEVTTEYESSPNAGEKRKNGESWCIYEGTVGKGQDLVGSRQYRALCINGEEIIEQCKDYREEFCIQQTQGSNISSLLESFGLKKGYIEAGCVPNRYQLCSACNDANILKNLYGGKCSGLEDPVPDAEAGSLVSGLDSTEESTNVNEAQILCAAKECCNDNVNKDCYWSEGSGSIFSFLSEDEYNQYLDGDEQKFYKDWEKSANGKCVPNIPPGMKFWTVSYNSGGNSSVSTDSTSECSKGNQECKVEWIRGGFARVWGFITDQDQGYDCVKNCQCMAEDWVISGNNYCRSLGDCGAYYNFNGDATFDGYVNTASAEKENDDLYFNGYKLKESDLGNVNALVSGSSNRERVSEFSKRWNWGNWLALGLQIGTTAYGGIFGSKNLEKAAQGGLNPLQILSGYSAFGTVVENSVIEGIRKNAELALTSDMRLLSIASNPELKKQFIEKAVSEELAEKGIEKVGENYVQKTILGNIMGTVNTIMTYYQILKLIDIVASEQQEKTYTISCNLWSAPDGGDNCEKCNDEKLGCSEYKCKSLGKTCELVNKGTTEEKCVDLNPRDVNSPIIEPLIKDKTIKYKKDANGYEVETEIKAYEAVKIGIKLNEPGQCKIDMEQGKEFDSMASNFQDSLLRYEHETTLNLPDELTDAKALKFSNGGKYTIYVRCKDGKGNANEKDYYIKFKIGTGPDLTAPIIYGTSPINNAYIASNIVDMPLSVFVSEPSTCKWSTNDIEYDDMNNIFSCVQSGLAVSSYASGSYECKTILKSVHQYRKFYIRCADQPGEKSRNYNSESYVFETRETEPLNITDIGPEGTFYNGEINLEVETIGGAENKASCYYSDLNTVIANMIKFETTDGTKHSQDLNLSNGNYILYIKCQDIAGNKAEDKLSIKITVDNYTPNLNQIYTTSSVLHIELDEEAKCEYDTIDSFKFGDGTLMTGEDTKIQEATLVEGAAKYYIKCRDKFNNELSAIIYI
ncbi:MAG: hypothetical protein PHG05_00120 [Candidatus Nanoarchaeia archaeon]|nr:hypothetical protein [Candidatus Nanoarchaeia archaeon]